MFSLQRLLGEDDKFLGLLEASAEECRASVSVLKGVVLHKSGPPTLNEFSNTRRKDKEITNKINDLLCHVSVTGLEREDIEALANSLYKIPKTIEKFAERYLRFYPEVSQVDFSLQVRLLEQATDAVASMLKELRGKYNIQEVKQRNERLQAVEAEADQVMLELQTNLYRSKEDLVKVLILKDLFELLEKVVDRCRDAGNVITHIVLKNS